MEPINLNCGDEDYDIEDYDNLDEFECVEEDCEYQKAKKNAGNNFRHFLLIKNPIIQKTRWQTAPSSYSIDRGNTVSLALVQTCH